MSDASSNGNRSGQVLSPREKFEAFTRAFTRDIDGWSPAQLLATSEGFQMAAEALEEIEETLSPELAWAVGEMLETRARVLQGTR